MLFPARYGIWRLKLSLLDHHIHCGPIELHLNAMDGFSAVVSTMQAASYAVDIIKSLVELRNVLKHGRRYLRNEQASIRQLHTIVSELSADDAVPSSDLGLLLEAISDSVNRLLTLLRRQRKHQIVVLLVLRRTEINDSFASLERQKNTLILQLTAQNSIAVASLRFETWRHRQSDLKMSKHHKSDSKVWTLIPAPHFLNRITGFYDRARFCLRVYGVVWISIAAILPRRPRSVNCSTAPEISRRRYGIRFIQNAPGATEGNCAIQWCIRTPL